MKSYRLSIISTAALLLLASCNRDDVTSPEHKDIVDAVFASGTVIMEDTYHVTSQTAGILTESFIKEGDSVKAGQLLFNLENNTEQAMEAGASANYRYADSNNSPHSPIWQKLKQQQLQALDQLATDSVQYVRYHNLYVSHAVAKAEMDKMKLAYENSKSNLRQIESNMADTRKSLQVEALNAKANYIAQKEGNKQTVFQAPYNGIVLNAPKAKGDLVKNGEMLAEIGSGDYLAKLMVSEDDISRVRLGQEVYIEFNTERGKSYKAHVCRIFPAFSDEDQSFIVEAKCDVETPALREGTQLQANIIIAARKQALVIPRRFLLDGNKVQVKGESNQRSVQKGIVTPEWVEIRAGLKETDKIIFRNNGKSN
jgi:multidrug resistance efflux pump